MNFLSEKLAALLKPVADIRPEERFKTWVMFFYFFLTISLIYILKPVRNALFLGELGAKNLGYVYIGEGIFLIFVTSAYIFLSRKFPRKQFFPGILLFFASNLVLFWFLFRAKVPYLSAYFYIWVASFSITSTTQFWMLANDIFETQGAKRLFGLIISGGSAGGVVGGILTSQLVRWLQAEDMMLVAAGVVVICAGMISFYWDDLINGGKPGTEVPVAEQPKGTKTGGGSKVITASSYFLMLGLIVMFAKMSSAIVDNQFNHMVEISIAGKEARTAFIGGFMAWMNVISFLMQLLVTTLCLRYLGVIRSLAILPLGLALFSGGTLVYPALIMALFLRTFEASTNYSIQQASKEVLFLPVQRDARYRAKPIIDMLGFRLAKSLAGGYILLAVYLTGIQYEKLGMLVIFLIPFWFFVLWRMKKGYGSIIETK
jgi:ATP:ADP antiporter, AAA family